MIFLYANLVSLSKFQPEDSISGGNSNEAVNFVALAGLLALFFESRVNQHLGLGASHGFILCSAYRNKLTCVNLFASVRL